MKVLLVDDLRNFRDGRKSVIARNSVEALAILNSDNVWDEIWLDHDLGIVDSIGIDTIMSVVDFMCEQAYNETPVEVATVYVHTSNPVGAKQIMSSLQNYGYNVIRVNAPEFFIVE